MMGKTQREEVRRAISHYFHRYRHVRAELRGKDLKAMKIPPGPIYRTVLQELLDARLDGEVKNRWEELAYLHQHYPQFFENEESGAPQKAAS